jgi:hypothetical protein
MTIGPIHPPHSDAEKAEQAALALLLHTYPALLSVDEVIRALTADCPDDFGPRDDYQNALRELVATGLAHRHGAFVFATRAAVRGDELQD